MQRQWGKGKGQGERDYEDVRHNQTYLDIGSAHSEGMDSGLYAGLRTRGIDDDVGTRAEFALLDHVFGVLFGADARALETCGGGVLEGKVQPLVVDVNGYNLGRSVGLCHGAAEQTHRAGAKHHDAVAGLDGSLPGNVNSHGGWLDQGALFKTHALGQLVAVILGQGVITCQGTVEGRCCSEPHVGAQVVLALLASYAAPTWDAWFHGHTVAYLERLHLVANRVHDAC